MSKCILLSHPSVRSSVERWSIRAKRANKNGYELAAAAGISGNHYSQLINFRIKSTKQSTLDAVETALNEWGV